MDDLPFRGSAAVAGGRRTWGELRGPRFRRLLPDIYQPADAPLDLRRRSMAAYLLVAGRGGALAGYSAAELHRTPCTPLDAPVEVIVTRGLDPRPGLRVHRDMLRPAEVCTVAGCRVTTPLRTAYDLARWSDVVEGVVAVDALAGRFGFHPGDLMALRRRGHRNCRRLEQVLRLADPEAESAMETRLRLLLVLAGLPPPAVQYPVTGPDARVLGWFDLAYPEARLGIEYDGRTHEQIARAVLDRRRDVEMATLGWQVLRFSAADVVGTPDRTVTRVRHVLAARGGPTGVRVRATTRRPTTRSKPADRPGIAAAPAPSSVSSLPGA